MVEVPRAGVLGFPVTHSLSPALHRAAYRVLELDWRYDAIECAQDSLRGLLLGLGPEWVGLSLTMPHKRTVLTMIDQIAPTAAGTEAVNTLLFRGDRRLGDNTDVPGLVNALAEHGITDLSGSQVGVVGAGATACSALAALAAMGAKKVSVLARRESSIAEIAPIAERFSLTVVPIAAEASGELASHDLIVATTPIGASAMLAVGLYGSKPAGLLFDVLYDPWPTPFAKAWQRAGGSVLGGLELLVHQGALQVLLMTGQIGFGEAARVDPSSSGYVELRDAMREAGTAALVAVHVARARDKESAAAALRSVGVDPDRPPIRPKRLFRR